jgi:hypothetical protein
MSTSGTYNFGSPQNEQIIREAYERIHIPMDIATDQKIKTALRSINCILQSWITKRLNLFTIKKAMLALVPGQTSYILPAYVADIKEAVLRTSVRNLGGVAASNQGGTAANAFDGNLTTSCVQTAPDGAISYAWSGPNYAISMLGVTTFVDNYYTLTAQYSYTGVDGTWLDALVLPRTLFTKNNLQWFVIDIPVPASYFRIVETGGATLNIAELYFNSNINDRRISACSRDDYMSFADKQDTGVPSCFWFDRQIDPILNLYKTPNSTYNNLFYTYERQIQDIGAMTDTAEIPGRFIEALISDLAYRLCVKEEKLQLEPILEKNYLIAFRDASLKDGEKIAFRITPKASNKWGE